MDKLVVLRYPDPRLRTKCAPVSDFGSELEALSLRMFEIMRASNGVGLAAPQIGILQRLFVCNHTGQPEDDRVVVNPEILELVGSTSGEEGCLSIPEVLVPVRRGQTCRLRAQDVSGKIYEVSGSDLQARVWQHENDHLNGKLITDYMDEASQLRNRRALKHLEDNYRGD